MKLYFYFEAEDEQTMFSDFKEFIFYLSDKKTEFKISHDEKRQRLYITNMNDSQLVKDAAKKFNINLSNEIN